MNPYNIFSSENAADGCSRRSFVKWMLVAAATTQLPLRAFGSTAPLNTPERSLSMYNMHTAESFTGTYWIEGSYLTGPINDINELLRDYRTDEVIPIDTKLLDLLFTIQQVHGGKQSFTVVSGYRSPETNKMLRKKGHKVGRHSLHMEGKAIDISLPGVNLHNLRTTAISLKGGGVGYYPGRNFVHVDTGRVRYW